MKLTMTTHKCFYFTPIFKESKMTSFTKVARVVRFSGLCAVALVCLMSGTSQAVILLEDDFNDNSLDAAKWTIVQNATETNQRIEFISTGLPHSGGLASVGSFDPAVNGLRITGQYEWGGPTGTREEGKIYTRAANTWASSAVHDVDMGISFRSTGMAATSTSTARAARWWSAAPTRPFRAV